MPPPDPIDPPPTDNQINDAEPPSRLIILKNRLRGLSQRQKYLVIAVIGLICLVILVKLAEPPGATPASVNKILNCRSDCSGTAVGHPYIDPSQLNLKWPKVSFYTQPWRGYQETVPAVQLLNGLGVNYNPNNETAAQDNAALKYLASIGIHAIRIELPWSAVDSSNETRLTPSNQARYAAIFKACQQYGISPTLLLNANDGDPEPNFASRSAKVVGSYLRGSDQITVNGVSPADIVVHTPGTTSGSSGLSLGPPDTKASNLITKVTPNPSGSLTLKLSQPIAHALIGGSVTIDYLKYLPLYPVGTAEFDNTISGWMRYVKTATGAVDAAGISNYSVEIWNELSFGSLFLSVANYDSTNVPWSQQFPITQGGRAWQLANQTTNYLKQRYGSNVQIIWGFSNTAFFTTPSMQLPAGTNGESYHPYWTAPYSASSVINDNQDTSNLAGGSYIPSIKIAIPEGITALPITRTQLIRGKLSPGATDPGPSPGFMHYITENGYAPKQGQPFGLSDHANQLVKAKALLRNYSFWLNKGISQLDWYSAFDDSSFFDRGFNLLAKNADHGASPVTLQSQAVQNFSDQFKGAKTITSPLTPNVSVKDITPSDNTPAYQVFASDPKAKEPALNYRQMFQFLPFQINNNRLVISTYVMGWNILKPPPPMYFNLDISRINGTRSTISYYDPISGRSAPFKIVSRSSNDVVVNIESLDYPRLLTIQEATP